MKSTKNVLNENDNFKDKEKENKNMKENESDRIFIPFEEPVVSLFENFYSKEPIGKISLSKFLRTSKFKEQVKDYRKSTDEKLRKKIKGNLMCITPSGIFSQRQEVGLIKHTGLLCIDIDFKDNPKWDLNKAKHIIGEHCPSLYYGGLSLSGKGIFLIFRISNPEYHKQHFEALAYLMSEKFDLQVDKGVKSPVSLRVASYDPNPYYNPNPVPFPYTMETDKKSGHVIRTVSQKNKIIEQVKKAVSIIQTKRIDITKQYQNWFRIGCALAHEFGEEGRGWFHMISRVHSEYHEPDCDFQYDKCLKYSKEDGAKIATFFYLCKCFGVKC